MTTCAVCGNAFPPKGRQIYCSVACRRRAEREKAKERRIAEFTEAASGIEPTGDRAEVLQLLMVAAKLGSVSAAKILLDELRRDAPAHPPDIIDELLARRRNR
jgi:hypothetical protein